MVILFTLVDNTVSLGEENGAPLGVFGGVVGPLAVGVPNTAEVMSSDW